jgi:hypothetical protein
MASFLTAIGSVDPQSSLFDRSVPHPAVLEADHGFPTSLDQPFVPPEFADHVLPESEIWWLWEPEMQYIEHQSIGDCSLLPTQ